VAASDLKIAAKQGSVVAGSNGVTIKTASPVSVTFELPEVARLVHIELSARLSGPGAGFLEVSLGEGSKSRVDFGPEGFSGIATALLPDGFTSDRLTILLNTTGAAQSEATITSVTIYGEPDGAPSNPTAPKPPATGNTAQAAPLGFDPRLALFAGALLVGTALALISRREIRP